MPEICYEMAESALQAEFAQTQDLSLRETPGTSFRMIRISCFAAYREVYRYIYRNPVEASLCHRAEHYPFSTLGELIGYRPPTHFVSDSLGVITNPFQILDWINDRDNQNAVLVH